MDLVIAVVLILAGSSGRLADVNPVGRPVASALEPVPLHERFQQVNGMAVAALPVGLDPLGNFRKNMIGQLGRLDPRQEQKATVIDESGEVLFAVDLILSYPAIPSLHAPSGGRKLQTSQYAGLGS